MATPITKVRYSLDGIDMDTVAKIDIKAGANSTINTPNLTITGIVSSTSITGQINTAVTTEALRATAAEGALQGQIVAVGVVAAGAAGAAASALAYTEARINTNGAAGAGEVHAEVLRLYQKGSTSRYGSINMRDGDNTTMRFNEECYFQQKAMFNDFITCSGDINSTGSESAVKAKYIRAFNPDNPLHIGMSIEYGLEVRSEIYMDAKTTFVRSNPVCIHVPEEVDHLTNKLYVDGMDSRAHTWTSTNSFNAYAPTSTLTNFNETDFITKQYCKILISNDFTSFRAANIDWTGLHTFNTSVPSTTIVNFGDNNFVTKLFVQSLFDSLFISTGTNNWAGINTFNTVLPTSTITTFNNVDFITKGGVNGLISTYDSNLKAAVISWTGAHTHSAAVSSTVTSFGDTDLITKNVASGLISTYDTNLKSSTIAWTGSQTHSAAVSSTVAIFGDTDFVTKAHVSSMIEGGGSSIVSATNAWTGYNTYNVRVPTSTLTTFGNLDFVTKGHVVDLISGGGSSVLQSNNSWTGSNSFAVAPTTTALSSSFGDTSLVTKVFVNSRISDSFTSFLASNNAFTGANSFSISPTTSALEASFQNTSLITKAYSSTQIGNALTNFVGSSIAWTGSQTFNIQIPTTTITTFSDTNFITKKFVTDSVTDLQSTSVLKTTNQNIAGIKTFTDRSQFVSSILDIPTSEAGTQVTIINSTNSDLDVSGTLLNEAVYHQIRTGTKGFYFSHGVTNPDTLYIGATTTVNSPNNILCLKQGVGLKINGSGTDTSSFTEALKVQGSARITGISTFDVVPICSAEPTATNHLSNKAYVDSKAASTLLPLNNTFSGSNTFTGNNIFFPSSNIDGNTIIKGLKAEIQAATTIFSGNTTSCTSSNITFANGLSGSTNFTGAALTLGCSTTSITGVTTIGGSTLTLSPSGGSTFTTNLQSTSNFDLNNVANSTSTSSICGASNWSGTFNLGTGTSSSGLIVLGGNSTTTQLMGVATAPNASYSDNSQKIATTSFVKSYFDNYYATDFAAIKSATQYQSVVSTPGITAYTSFSSPVRFGVGIDMYGSITIEGGTTITTDEMRYLSGVTSDVQTQLNTNSTNINTATNKLTNISYNNSVTTISNTTSLQDLSFTGSINTVSAAAFAFLSGVTSNVQNQLTSLFNRTTGMSYDSLSNVLSFNEYCSFNHAVGVSAGLLTFGETITQSNIYTLKGITGNIQAQINNIGSNGNTAFQRTTAQTYNAGTQITSFANTVQTSVLKFSSTINDVTDAVFQRISTLTSSAQDQLNSLFTRTTAISYDALNTTTTVVNTLASNILTFTGSINGISPTVLSRIGTLTSNAQDQLSTQASSISGLLNKTSAQSYDYTISKTTFTNNVSFTGIVTAASLKLSQSYPITDNYQVGVTQYLPFTVTPYDSSSSDIFQQLMTFTLPVAGVYIISFKWEIEVNNTNNIDKKAIFITDTLVTGFIPDSIAIPGNFNYFIENNDVVNNSGVRDRGGFSGPYVNTLTTGAKTMRVYGYITQSSTASNRPTFAMSGLFTRIA